jgi:predicted membrane protein (TIGR00267 family)
MVNTIFDSTFVILGVVIGSAFASHSDLEIVIGTILTSSVALAISTGVSVYEAESHEQETRVRKIESAMLRDMGGTEVARRSGASASIIAVANLSAPLIVCGILIWPFLVFGSDDMVFAGTVAIALAISILFVVGAALGRMSGRNPWVRGTRMAAIGFVAFLVCFFIETLV